VIVPMNGWNFGDGGRPGLVITRQADEPTGFAEMTR